MPDPNSMEEQQRRAVEAGVTPIIRRRGGGGGSGSGSGSDDETQPLTEHGKGTEPPENHGATLNAAQPAQAGPPTKAIGFLRAWMIPGVWSTTTSTMVTHAV